jgi:DNA-binding response OmpR family regulator
MRILVVEDDQDLARFIRKGLEEERHLVESASDGDMGWLLADAEGYDIIIMDVLLPKLNGLELCRRLRSKGDQTPVLLLTVRDTVEDTVCGLDAGADDYLTKPFAFAVLLARIRALVRRGGIAQPSRLTAADLELDPIAHRVWRSGKEVILTRREYALLEYLLRNKNRILTRTGIVDQVWGYAYDPMTNIVEVQIRALRAKVDRGFTPSLIHTVRGMGYMVKDEA